MAYDISFTAAYVPYSFIARSKVDVFVSGVDRDANVVTVVTDPLTYHGFLWALVVDELPERLSRFDMLTLDVVNRKIIDRKSNGVGFALPPAQRDAFKQLVARDPMLNHQPIVELTATFERRTDRTVVLRPHDEVQFGPTLEVEFLTNNHGWACGTDVRLIVCHDDGFGAIKRIGPGRAQDRHRFRKTSF